VKRAVRWTLEEMEINRPDLLVRVHLAMRRQHSGRFYAHAKTRWPRVWKRGATPENAVHLIVAHVPRNPTGRTDREMRGGPPTVWPESWIESLICIVAHEGHHFREFLFPQKGKPRHSEVEAEWTEYRMLKRWREL